MGAKEINWDQYTYRQKLDLLKTISQFEDHGWEDADGRKTQGAKDVATLTWDQLGDRELQIFYRWGVEK